ncbi:uncharacterized protein LOC114581130 [Dendrobium catenatum]|uniref:uncharacterized protein LOC114581130 n=1 Tax=Dendrobium catenatum TaxID=906689 RepID=UPI00109F5588|nr:uncharacterized protein LOC114581130 [Dendrobium catenatum]
MAPYEALYGRKCRTPLCWAETGERKIIGADLVDDATEKGVKRFGKVGKLSPRYVGPFEISERVGSVAYRLDLPSHMSRVHNVFHISSLRKYIADEAHKINTESIDIQPDLTFVDEPEKIIDYNVKQLRSREIPYVKVLWKHGCERDTIWEKESEMSESYQHLFD